MHTITPRWTAVAFLAGLAFLASPVAASEIGHFAPGVPGIRDFVVPEPGFYGVVYNYYYRTGQVNDRHGDEIDEIVLQARRHPRLRVRLDLDIDVDAYVLAPALMWVAPWKLGRLKFAGYVLPTFSNTSIAAALSTATGRGVNADTSTFGIGDTYVQPIWLGLTLDHWDFAFGMGFYAPTGRYNVNSVTLPRIGTVQAEAADNIGLGFWAQQTQLAGTWYPWANKATAVALAVTHEVNGNKEDFDLQPGQVVSFNWGISQYLPLVKSQELLLEGGPAGYGSWQVTDDTGADAVNPSVHDQVQGVGGQLGLTYVPWSLVANFHYFYEFVAVDRFQGESLGLNLAKKF